MRAKFSPSLVVGRNRSGREEESFCKKVGDGREYKEEKLSGGKKKKEGEYLLEG